VRTRYGLLSASYPARALQSARRRLRRIERGPAERSYDRFFFQLGIGGSGTQWCSTVLTTGRSYCFHNSSLALNTAEKREMTHFRLLADPRLLDPAWRREVVQSGRLSEMLEVMADRREPRVGTADEFAGFFADALYELHPRWRFLFVVRDGVKSVARWLRATPWPHYQAIDHLWVPGWDELPLFERACHRWRDRNRQLADRLAGLPEANARTTTLEALTTDLSELRSAWEWLEIPDWDRYERRNAELQGTAISKHQESRTIKHSREIWSNWTPEERQTFVRICAEDMERYGFPIPGPVRAAG
jgi:hypothetical protein